MGTRSNIYSYSYTNTYSKPHSYAYANTHSIKYSCSQSDSQASSHATSSADSAMKDCSAVTAIDMDVSAATHHLPSSRLEADTPYDGERNRRTGSLVAAIPSAITSGS
jgi:hypothetical protein